MSNMRKLLESISNFSFADPKAPEVKEGEECEVCHKDPCECDDKDLAEALMQEYKYFVQEADPAVIPVAGQTATSPVAAVNPPGTGNPAVSTTGTSTSQTTTTPPATTAPATGTVTPPNPQQVKQQTDALTKVLNNPAHPMNAQLQALIKKAGSIPS